jgi:hypothetical protein
MPSKTKATAEFGDFQTPAVLCRQVLNLVRQLPISPATIVEPSCGTGGFLAAAAEMFPAAALCAVEINPEYLKETKARLGARTALLINDSFFNVNWPQQIADLPGPILVIGNPPWVTNSTQSLLASNNIPTKSNFQNFTGLDALTGKSNFDISEWMLIRSLQWLHDKHGMLAVLCKLTVARKVLSFAWKHNIAIAEARIYRVDAASHFAAAVAACALILIIDGRSRSLGCAYYPHIESAVPSREFGNVDGVVVSDLETYTRYRGLRGESRRFTWRSGLKHDCAKVMELRRGADGLRNGYGERVQIEDTYVFPLVKSADICGFREAPQKYVIVPQSKVGEETRSIELRAPLTWAYLESHRSAFERRTSVIYRHKPDFSIFGIGGYSFAPWKIAISGLYKQLTFKLFGPREGKPVFFDDTVYFLPFADDDQARRVLELLRSAPAQGFLRSMIFWEDKRPITAELLRRLDLEQLEKSSCQLDRTNDDRRTTVA